MHNSYDLFIELYFAIGTVANICLFIIQGLKLYRVKDSTGLSFLTFFGFNLIQLSTILYGALREDALLMYGYIATFIACAFVTVMIPFYKRKKTNVKHHNK